MMDETREEAELELLFRSLDNGPTRATLDEVIARAEARPRTAWRWAAGIVAALAMSGAAWALPGSPVSGWIRGVFGSGGESPPAPAVDTGPAPAPGGLAFEPGEPLEVAVDEVSAGVLRIAITPEAQIVVQAVSGDVRFTSAPNRLGVALGQPDTLDVRIPDGAARVTVTVGGRAVFRKTGDAVTTSLSRDPEGRWVRELIGGR